MYTITLSIILYSLQYVNSFEVLFDTGFNHLTKTILHIVSDTNADLSTETRWIEQPLDHFDENNSQTWKMRYYERLEYFRRNGPVYVFIGGEGEAIPHFLSAGVIQELAQETGGAMFMTEHRYYGKSKPFDNLNTKNMKWLSSKQALADIAKFIKSIKSDRKFENSKVVMIGGSYAGNLAAWMKLKYSELIDAAVASSGPVLAKKDFYEYNEKVSDDYEKYGTQNCLEKTRTMFQRYKEMLQSPEGMEQLKREHNICSECDFNDVKNQWIFFMINMSPFMQQSQYGGPEKIRDHCSYLETIEKSNSSLIPNKPLWNTKKQCNDVSFKGFIDYINKKDYFHSWFYQVCTEFGYFQTTSSKSQPFGDVLPKDLYLETCKNLFGPDFDEARVDKGVKKSNDMYGGLAPRVTHVVFVNGDVDPWSTISVLKDISSDVPAIGISKATHCADLLVNRDSSEEIKQASKRIKNLVKKWIGVGIINDPLL